MKAEIRDGEITVIPDPCKNPPALGNLPQRVIGYNLSDGEKPLSDFRLTPKWYSLPDGFTIASKPDLCGTYFNWWLQGKFIVFDVHLIVHANIFDFV